MILEFFTLAVNGCFVLVLGTCWTAWRSVDVIQSKWRTVSSRNKMASRSTLSIVRTTPGKTSNHLQLRYCFFIFIFEVF